MNPNSKGNFSLHYQELSKLFFINLAASLIPPSKCIVESECISCIPALCICTRKSFRLLLCVMFFRFSVCRTRARTCKTSRARRRRRALLLSYQALILLCESQYHLSLPSHSLPQPIITWKERRKKKHKLPEKAKIKHQQQMISKSCRSLAFLAACAPNFPLSLINWGWN